MAIYCKLLGSLWIVLFVASPCCTSTKRKLQTCCRVRVCGGGVARSPYYRKSGGVNSGHFEINVLYHIDMTESNVRWIELIGDCM